jgi:hypothetical protein|tara:strand:- start:28 stop:201 length:174 start_codon:yes stop_codon:yes gene_type:complete
MEQHMTYVGLAIGVIFGAFLAIRRHGKILDILQYGAACGIIGGLLALIGNVVILRMG